MDFFGLGGATPTEFSSPIGQQVKLATDSLLIGPDWAKNLEICDMISSTSGGPSAALKAIQKRLADNDQNSVFLTLTLLETCIKNCDSKFVSAIDQSLMDDMTNLAREKRGAKNAAEALRLIQQWGRAFEQDRFRFPIFFDTYMNLRSRGFVFPQEDVKDAAAANFEVSAAKDRPSLSSSSGMDDASLAASLAAAEGRGEGAAVSQPAAVSSVPDPEAQAKKLGEDLDAVMEKVRMCREMLLVSPGIEKDEVLSNIVGFLEACRERMLDLIEAGSEGALSEALFESVLKVNDALLRTLEAEKTGKPIGVNDDDNALAGEEEKTQEPGKGPANLLDLDSSSPRGGRKADEWSKAEDDIFGSMDAKKPGAKGPGPSFSAGSAGLKSPAVPAAGAAAAAESKSDPFGDSDPFAVFNPPPPAPAPVKSPAAMAVNPFDAMDAAAARAPPAAAPPLPPIPPPPAPTSASTTAPIAAPSPSLKQETPPAAAAPAAPGTMTDADFDVFFDSLSKK